MSDFYLQQILFILRPKVAQTSSTSSLLRHSFLLVTESFALRERPSHQHLTFVTLYSYFWHWLAFLDISPITYPFRQMGSYGSSLERIHLSYLSLSFVSLRVVELVNTFFFLTWGQSYTERFVIGHAFGLIVTNILHLSFQLGVFRVLLDCRQTLPLWSACFFSCL